MKQQLLRVTLAWALIAALMAPTVMTAGAVCLDEPAPGENRAVQQYLKETTAVNTEVTWSDLAFPFVNSDKEVTGKNMPGIGYEACSSADGKPYKIPYERYTEIFNETAQAIAYYNSAQQWKGRAVKFDRYASGIRQARRTNG